MESQKPFISSELLIENLSKSKIFWSNKEFNELEDFMKFRKISFESQSEHFWMLLNCEFSTWGIFCALLSWIPAKHSSTKPDKQLWECSMWTYSFVVSLVELQQVKSLEIESSRWNRLHHMWMSPLELDYRNAIKQFRINPQKFLLLEKNTR